MPREEKLREMLAKEPNDVFLNFSLAMELAKTDQADECLARFDRVIELDANYVAAYFLKGKTLLKLHRQDEAKAVLQAGAAKAGQLGDRHAKDQMEQLLAAM